MERTELHQKMLQGASEAAEQAFNALQASEYASTPKRLKAAWLVATVIHCDLCRQLVAYEECERAGLARLLWMGDIVSKLYEARAWHQTVGNKVLIEIADEKTLGAEIRGRLKAMRTTYPLSGIDAYAAYRNTVGHHYDTNLGDHLQAFSIQDANEFYETVKHFVCYAHDWAKLFKAVLRGELPATPELS